MGRPDFTGIWRLDAAASTFSGPSPTAMLMKIDHHEPDLTQQTIATDPTGAERRNIFSFRIDEETISVVGETTLRCRAYWQDGGADELVIETLMSRGDRLLEFRDRWSLSADGAHLTMAHRDDDLAGQIVLLVRDETPASSAAFIILAPPP
jgi:hypothetical protein